MATNKKQKIKHEIILRSNAPIGYADAESDRVFLENCFIDTGAYEAIIDTECPQRIIVGRTGSGKTALMDHIKNNNDNVIDLPPETLSIQHISNSNIISFFEEIGLPNLEEFYVLLWKHVITVELLRKKFNIYTKNSQDTFLNKIETLFYDKSKKRAYEYLTKFGDKFWEDTQYRISEITTNIEDSLKASIGGAFKGLKFDLETANSLSETQKKDLVHQATNAVDKIQIKELHNIVNWLAEDVFKDTQNKFYILIDRLDEPWITNEKMKYKLIRALIETTRSFAKVRSVKIVVSIRKDLLHRVIENTNNDGFQYEKYKSQILELKWSAIELENLLNKRIQYLFESKYQKSYPVRLNDILSNDKIDTISVVKYILDRTFYRPREAIMFLNECLEVAQGSSRITKSHIKQAEYNYSGDRLRELQSEWGKNYSQLEICLNFLKKRKRQFRLDDIQQTEYDNLATMLATNDNKPSKEPLIKAAQECFADSTLSQKLCGELPQRYFKALYEIGIVGIKQENYEKTRWSFHDTSSIQQEEIINSTMFKVHPAYFNVLGIKPKSSNN